MTTTEVESVNRRGHCPRRFSFRNKPVKIKALLAVLVYVFCGQASARTLEENAPVARDVNAVFESKIMVAGRPQVTEWTLRRTAHRVEMQEGRNGTGEIWSRDEKGNISFERVFHKQRRVLDYSAADLRSLGSYPEWDKIADVIDPQLLGGALKHVGTTRVMGKTAERYRGRLGSTSMEVTWLPQDRLPYQVKQSGPNQRTELKLKQLSAVTPTSSDQDSTASYTRLDYADLGDDPSDPFFKRLFETAEHQH
ncbi:MAG: hypothetical protein HY028_00840 [Gammaproteobacteria bacterium]|nr:hypothetical protein [Gammaproteobacteria bacterium]